MTPAQAKKRMDELKSEISYHNKRYYVLDDPEIDDYEYDILMEELRELEKSFPQYLDKTSPSVIVGGEVSSSFEKVPHTVQMGSLQDVFDKNELYNFDKRIRSEIEFPVYVVEPKIDGLSVSLEYRDGVFVRGSTRGDGYIGEDVTENLRTIKNIPLKLNKPIPFLEVRGEVYMPKDVFLALLERQKEENGKIFKNPRNAAAGSLRQKYAKVTAERKLDIFIFNIQRADGISLSGHAESLDFLKQLSFKIIDGYKVFEDIGEAISYIDEIGIKRHDYPFDIDGAVIKINGFDHREILGDNSKYPRWAVAYKYPPEEAETTLLNIQVNIGRTGALTPTAVFDPVILAGTSVSRAVLHNQDYISEKDIRIGDRIVVRKAGDIIPEVVKSISHAESSEPYFLPESCPDCNFPVTRAEGESVLRCDNPECPAAKIRNIIHFASRGAMNIEGLGISTIKQLIAKGFITSPADIYTLKKDDLLDLDGFKEKSVRNLLDSIEKTKGNSLDKLIFALGIRNIGQSGAKLLSERFNSLDSVMKASEEEILTIDGFGEIMASNVVSFFKRPEIMDLIEKLKRCGLNTESKTTSSSDKLKGLNFVLTGGLSGYTRNEAKKIIEDLMGKVSSGVSKKTNYVLAGADAGNKLEKAREMGITIIDEDEFNKMIKD